MASALLSQVLLGVRGLGLQASPARFSAVRFAAAAPNAPAASNAAAAANPAARAPAVRAPAVRAAAAKPAGPKRPPTAWIRFLRDFRAEQQAAGVKKPNADICKTAAELWRNLNDADRAPYTEAYEADRKKYDELYVEYLASLKDRVYRRDPERPKVPATPFGFFTKEFHAQNPDLQRGETARKASKAWELMTEAQRAPYEQQYEKAKRQYMADMDQYRSAGKEAAWKLKKAAAEVKVTEAKKQARKKQRVAEEKVAAAKTKLENLIEAKAALRERTKGPNAKVQAKKEE